MPKQKKYSDLEETKVERAMALERRFMIPSPQPREQHLSERSESISTVDSSKSDSVDASQLSFIQKKQIFESKANSLQKISQGRG